jgi:hypothetical protein
MSAGIDDLVEPSILTVACIFLTMLKIQILMKKVSLLLLALGILVACKHVEPAANDTRSDASKPAMVMVSADDTEPETIPMLTLTKTDIGVQAVRYHDQAQLDLAQIVGGSTLQFALHFGGGCEAHDIEAFAQAKPGNKPGIDIYLSHNAHDDRCEAWLSSTYRIDLAAEIAQMQQSQGHGQLQVRIFTPALTPTVGATVMVPF